MKKPGPPETVQPTISGLVDVPVSFCGVPVIKGVGDLPRELLIAADANDNLPIGFHAPKHCTCHFSLHSKAVSGDCYPASLHDVLSCLVANIDNLPVACMG